MKTGFQKRGNTVGLSSRATRISAANQMSCVLSKTSRVKAIVLTSGQASAADTAKLLVELYPKLMRKLLNSAPPAMFTVTLAGTISQIKL